MGLKEHFKNVFSYGASLENWVNNSLPLGPLKMTFVSDFAIADWFGANDVIDTYERVKESWLSDYKAFTEVVIALNMLSWAHNAMREEGIEGREEFIKLYSNLYFQAKDDFYAKYDGNAEANDYFFEMTD